MYTELQTTAVMAHCTHIYFEGHTQEPQKTSIMMPNKYKTQVGLQHQESILQLGCGQA
jgi:hypothetical protein